MQIGFKESTFFTVQPRIQQDNACHAYGKFGRRTSFILVEDIPFPNRLW